MNHFANTSDTETKAHDSKAKTTGADAATGADAHKGTHEKHYRNQSDVMDAGRDNAETADPAKGPGTVRIKEAARQADAKQDSTDSSYPRYVFRKGSGRVQGDTGAFTAESMIVHKPEELQSLLDSGIWCRSPAEAGQTVDKDDTKKA